MTYFRVDDKLHSHRKTMRASVPAMGLWVLAGSWTMDQQTDGWIPDYAARRMDPAYLEHAAELVAAGYWHEAERDGDKGWQFHEWDAWQHSAEYLAKRRRDNANRMARKRANDRAGQGADLQEQGVHAHDAHSAQAPNPTQPKNTTSSRKRDGQTDADKAGEDFARFWDLYPHKVGKQQAAKAWLKAMRQGAEVAAIATGLRNAVAVWTAEGRVRGGKVVGSEHYVPHPSTWLNGGRWEDDQAAIDVPDQPTRPPTLSQCDSPDCPNVRHEWTDAANRYVCMGA